jgi:hypothetical protein
MVNGGFAGTGAVVWPSAASASNGAKRSNFPAVMKFMSNLD